MYDLNQIPYDYTVKVTNRFKGIDLIDRVPEELWTEVRNMVQEVVINPSSRRRNAKRQNEKALQIADPGSIPGLGRSLGEGNGY